MAEVKLIDATGWKAVPVILAVLAFVGYRSYLVHTPLHSGAEPVVKQWLKHGYGSHALELLEGVDRKHVTEEQGEWLLGETAKLDRIQIESMNAKGSSDDIVARVEVSVDGTTPPDGRSVRYLRMRHSMIAGWRVKWDTNAWAYYWKLW